ncbi:MULTISPECIES: thiamine pyrophosphate-dependent dehydrogenase E1 component subunit alpha [unclassified Pseudofrankia]|uniref:thiamine pyrophosphate-dependent dehydrogenase E1 component subunit alpha n=1 Tax=unclassified Pseudofrankia TaxID=2994372 RepID=UPI0008D90CBF|nr:MULTISPECIES: thiamine pyrophosphate-dependent dehydrogenase E1 component subunit alpha [unclassified Pseudofrankia]MDT3442251.1 thiamine pyrophosphate-dependent dehydrogenase E1 component subunit alpha [Pseudofrankia sp. BMG5.37]OHV43543.1 pyruvate dehydrogenase [Pseudofrankia sp. BMG5.36]
MGVATLSTDVQRRIYRLMARMKAVDDRLTKGILSGEFIAIYFSHRGQEGVAAALGAALRETDQLVTTYRGAHDHIGKGIPLVDLFAEIMGKEIAPAKGKSGTMHIASPETGVMLSTGMVGSGIPVAVGLALAAQLDGSDRVVAVSFGDGATNTGAFHEAANMAALWNLPLVMVCQNNLYAEKTPTDHTMKIKKISARATAYDIVGVTVNGNDPDETYAAMSEAVERARSGGGPTLVEALTFRLRGHAIGDDMVYIPKEQLAEAEKNDPYPAYRQRLISSGAFSEDELAAIEAEATAAVNAAVKTVAAAEFPAVETLMEHVYANPEKAPA